MNSLYIKAITAITAALAILGNGLADGHLTSSEIVSVAIAFFGALGVYALPNTPK